MLFAPMSMVPPAAPTFGPPVLLLVGSDADCVRTVEESVVGTERRSPPPSQRAGGRRRLCGDRSGRIRSFVHTPTDRTDSVVVGSEAMSRRMRLCSVVVGGSGAEGPGGGGWGALALAVASSDAVVVCLRDGAPLDLVALDVLRRSLLANREVIVSAVVVVATDAAADAPGRRRDRWCPAWIRERAWCPPAVLRPSAPGAAYATWLSDLFDEMTELDPFPSITRHPSRAWLDTVPFRPMVDSRVGGSPECPRRARGLDGDGGHGRRMLGILNRALACGGGGDGDGDGEYNHPSRHLLHRRRRHGSSSSSSSSSPCDPTCGCCCRLA